MKNFLILLILLIPSIGNAQFDSLLVEEVDNGGVVEGKTYRIYVVVKNVGDQVLAVFGEPENHLHIQSTEDFYQNKYGGDLSADVNRHLVKEKPELAFDSWLTIAREDNVKNNIRTITGDLSAFENGEDLIITDAAWFVTPDDEQAAAGKDKKILIAQLTSKGKITGVIGIYGRTGSNSLDEDGNPLWENWKVEGIRFSCGE